MTLLVKIKYNFLARIYDYISKGECDEKSNQNGFSHYDGINAVWLERICSRLYINERSQTPGDYQQSVFCQKSKKWKNKKSRKAAGSGVSKKAKRPNKSVKSIREIAAESAAKSGSKSKTYEMEGKVIKQMPNAVFQVELKNGSTVIAHISGKLRMNFIRIRFGDRVLVEVFTDRPDKGRIIWRYKDSL